MIRNSELATGKESIFLEAAETADVVQTDKLLDAPIPISYGEVGKYQTRALDRSSTLKSLNSLGTLACHSSFEKDATIDADESDVRLQFLLVGCENVLTYGGSDVANIPAQRKKDDTPVVRLMRCISKVMASAKRYHVQERMQRLVVQLRLQQSQLESKILSEAMDTPRTAQHPKERLQHFERIRKEGDLHQYVGLPDLLSQKVLLQPRGAVPIELRPGSRCYTSGSGTFSSRPGTTFSSRPGTKAFSRTQSDSSTCLWDELPATPSMPSKPRPSRRHKCKGIIKELALHTRLGRDGRTSEKLSPRRNTQHVDVLDDWHGGCMPLDGLDLSNAPAVQKAEAKQTKRRKPDMAYKETLDQDLLIPKLTGTTSGYAEKDPSLECPWVTSPRKEGHRKAERFMTNGPESSKTNGKAGLLESACGLTRPSTTCLPPVAHKANSQHKDPFKTIKFSSTDSWRSNSYAHRSCPDLRDVYDSQVCRFTGGFMQDRGWEEKGKDSVLRDVKMTIDANDNDWSCVVTRLSRSHPKLTQKHCFPSPLWKTLDLESDEAVTPGQRCCTAEVGYLRGCSHEMVNPRLVKFLAVPSHKLDLQAMLLSDNDLEAVLEALSAPQRLGSTPSHANARPAIDYINLASNQRLTDASMSLFLTMALRGNKMLSSAPIGPLKYLSLAHCTGLGEKTIGTLAKTLCQGTELLSLNELDLTGVAVPFMSWTPLTEGLSGRRSIRRLRLAHTQCGWQSQSSCRLVANLIDGDTCKNLEYIDISGNHFLHEGCKAIGAALRDATDSMQEIDMSHNAGFGSCPSWQLHMLSSEHDALVQKDMEQGKLEKCSTAFNPIMHVLETLGETTVTRVSFNNCQLQYAEDCILEDVVQSSDITHLYVSDNPHGEQGLRCLTRMLVRGRPSDTQLEHLSVLSVRNNNSTGDALTYDHVDPSAIYRVQLEHPQHRSILRLILKRAEACTEGRGKELSCFTNETYNGKRLKNGLSELCSKRMDRGGDDWQVPNTGILGFTFKQPPFYKQEDDVGTVMQKFGQAQKLVVTYNAFARLIRLYNTLPDERSKLMLISGMSEDMVLKLCQVRYLCKAAPEMYLFIVATLLPSIEENTSRMILFDLVESCHTRAMPAMVQQVKRETRSQLHFNSQHPDGHYDLTLGNKVDRVVAQHCIVISNWTKNRSIARGWIDLSEHGNHECLRHCSHQRRSIIFDSEEWQLPEDGNFSFDLVLPRLRHDPRNVVSESTLRALKLAISDSNCNFRSKLTVLRLIAHLLVLRPEQLKEIIQLFPFWDPVYGQVHKDHLGYDFRPRADVYITLYNRTLYNAQIVSPYLLYSTEVFHTDETKDIQNRMGHIHTFDVMNAHEKTSNLGNFFGPLDMHTYDGWLIVKLLIQISLSEPSPTNFYHTEWSARGSGLSKQGYVFIIPIAWVPDPPRSGIFSTTFQSTQEEVNYAKRKELATTFLDWSFPPEQALKRGALMGRHASSDSLGSHLSCPDSPLSPKSQFQRSRRQSSESQAK